MHYKAAWACGQAALRLAHMPTRRYDHHRLSPLVSTRNDEGPQLWIDGIARSNEQASGTAKITGLRFSNERLLSDITTSAIKNIASFHQMFG